MKRPYAVTMTGERQHARGSVTTPLLRFSNVALNRGGRLLFEGLDLELGPGDGLHVAGPNGSGKSSLIRLAAGLLPATRGEVQREAATLADDSLALDRELPLARALAFWGGETAPAMEALGIAIWRTCRCGCCRPVSRSARHLARVAASGAPLWLLDEPLNALDAEGSERLARLVAAPSRGGRSGRSPPRTSRWPERGAGWSSANDRPADRPRRPPRPDRRGMASDRLFPARRHPDAVRDRARRARCSGGSEPARCGSQR